jgi:K+ transporter
LFSRSGLAYTAPWCRRQRLLSFARKTIPKAFDAFTKRLRTIPERVVFLTVELADTPTVRSEDRVRVKSFGSTFNRVIVRYGFMERKLDVHQVLAEAYRQGLPGHESDLVTYFTSRYSVHCAAEKRPLL